MQDASSVIVSEINTQELGDEMAKTLHKEVEARLTPCMITTGVIMTVIMVIVMFIITMPVTLA